MAGSELLSRQKPQASAVPVDARVERIEWTYFDMPISVNVDESIPGEWIQRDTGKATFVLKARAFGGNCELLVPDETLHMFWVPLEACTFGARVAPPTGERHSH